MNDSDKLAIANDLTLMVKAGLVELRMREDGEWVYHASEYSKSLTPEQLFSIIENLDDYDE